MKAIQRVIEIPLEEVRSEKYNDNIERLGEHEDTCFICGLRLKGRLPKYVQYLTNGNIGSTDQSHEESQGLFPVGPDCAKRLVINFAL